MLRRVITNVLVNSFTASTITALGGNCSGKVSIADYGEIDNAWIQSCFFKCATAGRNKTVAVTVVIPNSCECPYEWGVTTVCYPSSQYGSRYEINETFNVPRYYGYQDPAGGVPTAAATAAAIAANINADKYACVTAFNVPGSAVITLTSIDSSHGFDAYTPSGSVNVVNAGAKAYLSVDQLAKLFPIQPGQFGARPDLTNCGAYCEYAFVINKSIQDISAASHYNDYVEEVHFYVRNDVANYFQQWHDKLNCNFPCLSANSGISGHIS